jgi:hypothetical protein
MDIGQSTTYRATTSTKAQDPLNTESPALYFKDTLYLAKLSEDIAYMFAISHNTSTYNAASDKASCEH